MSCEQTLTNINSVVNAMSNTQGDMVSDVEQLKKNWEDFSTLFAQLVEQNNIMNENQKIIVENVLLELAYTLKKIYPNADIDHPDLLLKSLIY